MKKIILFLLMLTGFYSAFNCTEYSKQSREVIMATSLNNWEVFCLHPMNTVLPVVPRGQNTGSNVRL